MSGAEKASLALVLITIGLLAFAQFSRNNELDLRVNTSRLAAFLAIIAILAADLFLFRVEQVSSLRARERLVERLALVQRAAAGEDPAVLKAEEKAIAYPSNFSIMMSGTGRSLQHWLKSFFRPPQPSTLRAFSDEVDTGSSQKMR